MNETYLEYDQYTKPYLNMTLVLKDADLSGKKINRLTTKISGFRTCEQKDYDRIGLKDYVIG
jgi:hypothetical protein